MKLVHPAVGPPPELQLQSSDCDVHVNEDESAPAYDDGDGEGGHVRTALVAVAGQELFHSNFRRSCCIHHNFPFADPAHCTFRQRQYGACACKKENK